jgi:hypothetical protein
LTCWPNLRQRLVHVLKGHTTYPRRQSRTKILPGRCAVSGIWSVIAREDKSRSVTFAGSPVTYPVCKAGTQSQDVGSAIGALTEVVEDASHHERAAQGRREDGHGDACDQRAAQTAGEATV